MFTSYTFADVWQIMTQYANMVFHNHSNNNIEVLEYTSSRPLTSHEYCIIYCVEKYHECNMVFVAYKNDSDIIDWCMWYKTTAGNLTLLPIDGTGLLPYWTNLWSEHGGIPAKSHLITLGMYFLMIFFWGFHSGVCVTLES